jgi:hypothetical protein
MRVNAVPAYVIAPDASEMVASVTSYKAGANPADSEPTKGLFGAIDGLVPDRDKKVAFGQALIVYPVPGSVAANALNADK